MVGKKGQATLFIILGIVLVVIVVLLFYTRTIELPRRYVESAQVSPVDAYVESCVKEIVEVEVRERMKYGGHNRLMREEGLIVYGDTGEYNLFYDCKSNCINNGESYLPTKVDIENDISKEVGDYLDSPNCDLSRFGDADYTRLNVNTMLNDENVIVSVFLPITIGRGESAVVKDTFIVKVDSELGKLWNIMFEIVEMNWARRGEFSVDDYNTKNLGSEFTITGPHELFWAYPSNTNIYGVKKRGEEEEMRFAVRTPET